MSTADDQLRDRIAAAIRDAAHDCDGHCGLTEAECDAQHPIQVAVLHFEQAADVTASITVLADVAAAVVQPELDQLRAERDAALADLEQYEAQSPQQCPAGVHPDWLVDSQNAHACPWCETERLHVELAGARATIEHMSKAMSWISSHDRQGLDHLDEAMREARGRESAVRQAQQWAVRAESAEVERDAARAQVAAMQAALTEPGLHPEQRLRALHELLRAADPTTT